MKTYTKEEVAACIDHAVLKAEFTDLDLKEHAAMCIDNGVFSMCVKPCDVAMAVELLKESNVKVSCVLSFPHGADTTEAKAFQASDVKVKVIQESGYLSPGQVAKACELAYEAGADFVKTSTGFGPGSATPEIIEIMKNTVGEVMSVKPSGGIRNWETAVAYLEQGADRLGVGSTQSVLNGSETKDEY